MKYENAKDILPKDILELVQTYAAGKLLYVPINHEEKSWGEISGYRKKLQKRNQMICNKYKCGSTLSELADEYFLSLDSIKKILYCKKDKLLEYNSTLASALCYAYEGMLEEWIETYLMNHKTGKYYDEWKQGSYICYGIVKVPLRLTVTMVTDRKQQVQLETSNHRVIEDSMNNLEPLILYYEDMKFYVELQQELYIQLTSHKINAYPSIIMVADKEEYKLFMKYFGKHLIMVNKI